MTTVQRLAEMPTSASSMDTPTDYELFLARKRVKVDAVGFDVAESDILPMLKPFQSAITRWALRRGRAAIFADCGLGKTPMQLEWASQITRRVGKPVLVLAPLAVARQTQREGEKFGIPVTVCRTQSDVRPGVNVANYEMLEHFHAPDFGGIVLDESSILKSFDGSTRKALCVFASVIPYRLACSATPAPNDLIELTNHSEFLGIMSGKEIVALFFTQDGNTTHAWRLKGHAQQDFWRWMALWSVAVRKPSDLGFSDDGFDLPPLTHHQIEVSASPLDGHLFVFEAQTLQERQQARRSSIDERVSAAAALVNASDEPWIVWCHLNAESEALTRAIPGAVQVTGSDSPDYKEAAVSWFSGGLCLCDKLSGCQTPNISNAITRLIAKSDWRNQLNTKGNIETNAGPTCEPTCGTTRNVQTSSLESLPSVMNASGNGENNTSQVLTCSSDTEKTQGHGRTIIPIGDSLSDFGLTVLPQKTTDVSLQIKETDAPFVDEPKAQTKRAVRKTEGAGSTLTTVTVSGQSVESFVRPAIWASVNLETARNYLNEQRCICGNPMGRRVLVTKSSICGFGLNWQHCAKMVFVGLSDSFEQMYQGIRRVWRFGQTRPVDVYIVTSESEGAVVRNIQRKERQAEEMFASIVQHMAGLSLGKAERDEMTYNERDATGDGWRLMLGDSVQRLKDIETESVGLSVFSPPFPGMYAYTNSAHDMGNTRTFIEMIDQFKFLIPELLRVTSPGRHCCVHLTQAVAFKGVDGYIGLKDFRGKVIEAMESGGWVYYGEVCIDKDPQVKAIRTKDRGLLFKTLANDSSHMHMALADYLLQFRKPGESNPIRAGISEKYDNASGWITSEQWIEWAAPVWYRKTPGYPGGISETDVLNVSQARETDDERHLCPLQLGVIERAIKLWSAPGDLVLDPFAGIGSTGHEALKLGRRFVGCELKDSYWKQAARNLEIASKMAHQDTLLSLAHREETTV